MITRAEASGRIQPGDTLIEATSGNTGAAPRTSLNGSKEIIRKI